MINKITTFFSEVKKEANKVTWPTRKETVMTSVMVVVLSGIMSIFFLVVDGGLSFLSRALINLRF
ncbi:MAG: preprotein translocase subunit SecE [Alphaproteobacteria bacterium]|nr:preprotein translocase subunit SecE [Alphaproteobacteria bacterium]